MIDHTSAKQLNRLLIEIAKEFAGSRIDEFKRQQQRAAEKLFDAGYLRLNKEGEKYIVMPDRNVD